MNTKHRIKLFVHHDKRPCSAPVLTMCIRPLNLHTKLSHQTSSGTRNSARCNEPDFERLSMYESLLTMAKDFPLAAGPLKFNKLL